MAQQIPEPLAIDHTGKTERLGTGTDPHAGCLLRTGVVLLGAARDRVDVIGVLTGSQLPDAQHDIPFRMPRPRTRRHRTTRASASKFLVRSGRATSKAMPVLVGLRSPGGSA